MPTIKILVRKIDEGTGHEVAGPIEMGKRFLFTEDLVLEEYDDSTPGSGLPENEPERLAGKHSGEVTLVRVTQPGDRFFPFPSLLFQYEATYKFNTLDDTPLQKGQVTAHGVVLIDNVGDWNNLELPIRFAITGGTGPTPKGRTVGLRPASFPYLPAPMPSPRSIPWAVGLRGHRTMTTARVRQLRPTRS